MATHSTDERHVWGFLVAGGYYGHTPTASTCKQTVLKICKHDTTYKPGHYFCRPTHVQVKSTEVIGIYIQLVEGMVLRTYMYIHSIALSGIPHLAICTAEIQDSHLKWSGHMYFWHH